MDQCIKALPQAKLLKIKIDPQIAKFTFNPDNTLFETRCPQFHVE